jgi:hypothetical protein
MKGSFNRTWLRLIRPRPRLAMLACAGLLCAIVAPVLDAAPAGAAPIASSFAQVFEDDFSATTVNQAVWRVFQDPTTPARTSSSTTAW